MCNIQRQHIQFKQRLNKIDSNHNKDFPTAFIDDFLYEAALDYVDIFGGNNPQKALLHGFEVTQVRIDMLSTLVVDIGTLDNPLLPNHAINAITESGYFRNEFLLGTSTQPYFHKVRFTAVTDCGNKGIEVVQHDDLNVILTDEYQKPDLNWGRVIGVIRKSSNQNISSLYVYSDKPITGLLGQYLKRPNKPFFGGYDTLEFLQDIPGFPSATDAPINLDIPEQYCQVVVDIAVNNVSGNLKDYNHTQYLQQKQQLNY